MNRLLKTPVYTMIPNPTIKIPATTLMVGRYLLSFFNTFKDQLIKIAVRMNGNPKPIEYIPSKYTPFNRSALLLARVKIEPKTGPTHGVQPTENAMPIKRELNGPGLPLGKLNRISLERGANLISSVI
jgi:hypothetical protein